MFLEKLLENKKRQLNHKKKTVSLRDLQSEVSNLSPTRDFKAALAKPDLSLIAEVKKASPSKGIIREDFNPVEIARIYETSGASAVSVLTEEKYFLGGFDHLEAVKQAISLPVLCKDFIFDPYQVYEARVRGADAILLIKAIMDKKDLVDLYDLAQDLSLDCLAEVHAEDELDQVLAAEAEIIGINNRDLNTFEVDISTTPKLAKKIPEDKIIVSESGIHTHQDVEALKKTGVDAILVGESLLRAPDIGTKIRELLRNEG